MDEIMGRRTFTKLAAIEGCALALAAGLTACGAPDDGGARGSAAAAESPRTIIVFAAASLTESLSKAADAFVGEHPGYEVAFNFDSSGTLKTQIQEGADCDVFISAGQLQMNQLDAADTTGSNTEGLDCIASDTRFDILENEVVLVVPEGNLAGITSFDALAAALEEGSVLMAMGNADVPVGQYTQLIFEYYGLDEGELAAAGELTYGTNVKEVTTQVAEGAVDCGVVYRTDAYSAGLEVVDSATEEMCGRVVYPAAVTSAAPDPEGAEAFLEFLTGQEAAECFTEVGFTPLVDDGR